MSYCSVAVLVLSILATAMALPWDPDTESERTSSPDPRWRAKDRHSDLHERQNFRKEVRSRKQALHASLLTTHMLT